MARRPPTAPRPVMVGDLARLPPTTRYAPRPFLRCANCGETYSATPGDYFMASPTHVFMCCGRPCQLVTKRTTYEEVQL